MLEDLGLDLGSIPNQLYNPEKIISFMKEVQQQWLQKIFGGGDVNEIMYVKALYVKYKCLFYINCLEVRWCYLEQKVTQESIILILSFYNKCFLGKWGHREAKYFLQGHTDISGNDNVRMWLGLFQTGFLSATAGNTLEGKRTWESWSSKNNIRNHKMKNANTLQRKSIYRIYFLCEDTWNCSCADGKSLWATIVHFHIKGKL